MPISECYLFKNSLEYLPASQIDDVPNMVRGIYVLFHSLGEKKMDVVYIGMARGQRSGIKGRLKNHRISKSDMWTHFSVFEVWDNITKEQVEELEGLFRHIYRHDGSANKLNIQKSYQPLRKIRRKGENDWKL